MQAQQRQLGCSWAGDDVQQVLGSAGSSASAASWSPGALNSGFAAKTSAAAAKHLWRSCASSPPPHRAVEHDLGRLGGPSQPGLALHHRLPAVISDDQRAAQVGLFAGVLRKLSCDLVQPPAVRILRGQVTKQFIYVTSGDVLGPCAHRHSRMQARASSPPQTHLPRALHQSAWNTMLNDDW